MKWSALISGGASIGWLLSHLPLVLSVPTGQVGSEVDLGKRSLPKYVFAHFMVGDDLSGAGEEGL